MFKDVNIHWYPEILQNNERQITIGDLHSNALLLVYILIRHRVLKVSESQYLKLVNIYQSLVQNPYQVEMFHDFLKIIYQAEIDKKPFIRFMGDELADRGANDLLILFIFKKLQESSVPYRILLSNHGLCFLSRYTALVKGVEQRHPMVPQGFSISFDVLLIYSFEEYIDIKTIKTWVSQAYLPYLELFDYSLYENQVTLYTHGITGIEQFKELAKEFNIDWHVHDLVSLASTLEKIKIHFKQEKLYPLLDAFVDTANDNWEEYLKNMEWFRGSVMYFLCENRLVSPNVLTRPRVFQNFLLKYVHGHHHEANPPENVISLDGNLGKHHRLHQGFLMEYLCNGADLKSYRETINKQVSFPLTRLFLPCLGMMAFGYLFNQFSNHRFIFTWMQDYICSLSKELNSTHSSAKLTL